MLRPEATTAGPVVNSCLRRAARAKGSKSSGYARALPDGVVNGGKTARHDREQQGRDLHLRPARDHERCDRAGTFRNTYAVALERDDSTAASQRMRELNRERHDAVVRRLEMTQYRLVDCGVAGDTAPVKVFPPLSDR